MELEEYVGRVLKDVKRRGIEAVKEYSRRFDGYDGEFLVSDEEFKEAEERLANGEKEIIRKTMERIRDHHEKQAEKDSLYIKNSSLYGIIYKPIRRIGIYVPGVRPLPSTLMMIGIPAKVAGVREMVVTVPPRNGKADPYVLYIAKLLGVREVYKLGGIQAIAAMAYGIGMRKVDKIFGPGNKYVNEAKRQVFGTVGIDSLAGPSEVCIIADESANEEYVLMDLLSQLEHGKDSKAWLITTSRDLAKYCNKHGIEVRLCESLEECIRSANEIAPEHLEIITKDPMKMVESVENAGAIYLGEYTPVPAADYFLGVNHVLPTGGTAKFSSVLTVMDFMKRISLAYVSREEFLRERHLGMALAEMEGMKWHKRSMEVRE